MAKPIPEMRWDAAFLDTRARNQETDASAIRNEADWQAATNYTLQVVADSENAYASCPVARCRRARRCMLDQPPCIAWFGLTWLPEFDDALRDEEYAERQVARRDAVIPGRERRSR